MKSIRIRLIMATLVVTGMVALSASSEARVRDPISRKNSPQKGFFESRPSTSTYVRSTTRYASPVIVSSPAVNRLNNTVITTAPSVPVQYVQPAQPRSQYIRVR